MSAGNTSKLELKDPFELTRNGGTFVGQGLEGVEKGYKAVVVSMKGYDRHQTNVYPTHSLSLCMYEVSPS